MRLQPYFENFGKRMVKAPKLYFTDVGLATYLLGIETSIQMSRDPLRGNLVENLVVIELAKARLNQGLDPQLYFFRDVHGHEVDIVFQTGRELIPVEVKSAQTFDTKFTKNLRQFRELVGERCPSGYVVYTGDEEQTIGLFRLVTIANAASIVEAS
jgi:predicted AAA+ superfamily ATPase